MTNDNPDVGGAINYERYSSGTVPTTDDTRRMRWVKKLWTIQGALGLLAKPHNSPSRFDTVRVLLVKCVRAENGK